MIDTSMGEGASVAVSPGPQLSDVTLGLVS